MLLPLALLRSLLQCHKRLCEVIKTYSGVGFCWTIENNLVLLTIFSQHIEHHRCRQMVSWPVKRGNFSMKYLQHHHIYNILLPVYYLNYKISYIGKCVDNELYSQFGSKICIFKLHLRIFTRRSINVFFLFLVDNEHISQHQSYLSSDLHFTNTLRY